MDYANKLNKTTAEMVRELRAAEWSYARIARALGVTPHAVSKWMQRSSTPYSETLDRLRRLHAQVCGAPVGVATPGAPVSVRPGQSRRIVPPAPRPGAPASPDAGASPSPQAALLSYQEAVAIIFRLGGEPYRPLLDNLLELAAKLSVLNTPPE